MTVHTIKMPDIGEGIAEVELVEWHVQIGDQVHEDQVLADVMTDKASVEIPSPVAGRVLALGGDVGQLMAVGAELISIEVAGTAAQASAAAAPAATPSASAGVAAATVAAAPAPPAAAAARAPASPASPAPPRTAAPQAQRPVASPAVRARAWELGIDLHTVAASSASGRILHADLDRHLAQHSTRAVPPPAAAPAAAAHAPLAAVGSQATHEIKIVGLRRKIAQKMQESKRRIPHYTYVEEIDITELEALRQRLNTQWGDARGRLTLLPFLVVALVRALPKFPQVNARFDDEAGVLTRHDAVHLGIATQTDAGLLVPVLRNAQAHGLWSSAAEVLRLAEAARSGKAVRDELSGSTITITSLGKLGGIVSTPVINHPEVAIVGVNRATLRPMIRDGAVVPRLMMNLSSSFDHRVVDGAVGAAFVQALRELLEHPATLFID